MLEIQQAHTAQQVYVQKLQDKLSDISRYRSTIKIQEQIIRKFESLLNQSIKEQEERKTFTQNTERETTVAETISHPVVTNHETLVASLERENKMLLSRIHDLETSLDQSRKTSDQKQNYDDSLEVFKRELEAERKTYEILLLIQRLLQLENIPSKKKNGDECADFALLLRAEKAEARVAALEQELEESAIEFSQKVVELEDRLRELQK